MESRFDGNLVDRLMSAGHDVEVLAEAYSDTMGHAGAVVLHPNGTLEGGARSARRRRRGRGLTSGNGSQRCARLHSAALRAICRGRMIRIDILLLALLLWASPRPRARTRMSG